MSAVFSAGNGGGEGVPAPPIGAWRCCEPSANVAMAQARLVAGNMLQKNTEEELQSVHGGTRGSVHGGTRGSVHGGKSAHGGKSVRGSSRGGPSVASPAARDNVLNSMHRRALPQHPPSPLCRPFSLLPLLPTSFAFSLLPLPDVCLPCVRSVSADRSVLDVLESQSPLEEFLENRFLSAERYTSFLARRNTPTTQPPPFRCTLAHG